MRQLRGTEFEQYVNLVELFAYGTYADYRGACMSCEHRHEACMHSHQDTKTRHQ
jgi:hypothetical protein